MDTADNVKVETCYGHCRCCLGEGHHRDITKVYTRNGHREIYSDIFLDCFNVFLSTNANLSTLICTSCVDELRRAQAFKQLVIRTEQQLMDVLQTCNDDQMVLVNVPVSKETLSTTIGFKIKMQDYEEPKLNVANSGGGGDVTGESSHNTGDEMATISLIKPKVEEADESDDDFVVPDSPPKEKIIIPDPKKREKIALISNTLTLLQNCNATLFKSKIRAGFPCIYCRDIFDNLDLLRKHQTSEHERHYLIRMLKKYTAESLVVYADVTDLKCILCDVAIPSLKQLKAHLIEIHEKRFYSKVTDRVIPFKLLENYFECQICTFKFETFGAIERHMNTHYRNYVCIICGGGFVTKLRLKTHLYSHNRGTYPCEYCDKIFTTQMRYKGHVDFVHKMLKKLKCQKCSERFSDYFVQKKHMVKVHGEVPIVYRCNVCSKGFNRRYNLSCHMKRHLDQKDVKCDLCTYSCYNRTELKEHMLKHNKQNLERTFQCGICDKFYSRKKTLREHMRIHSDDRRYACQICDQAFVQSNSLKTHMRNHHREISE